MMEKADYDYYEDYSVGNNPCYNDNLDMNQQDSEFGIRLKKKIYEIINQTYYEARTSEQCEFAVKISIYFFY